MFGINKICKGFYVIASLLLLLLLSSCNTVEINKDIVLFEYDFGGYPGYIWDYKIELKEEKMLFTAKGWNGLDLDIQEAPITSEDMDKLYSIIEKHNINKWDGFNKSDDNVADGSGFSLYIEDGAGNVIKASGHMKFPKNYDEVRSELSEFFDDLAEKNS